METPAFPPPKDGQEAQILDRLTAIRDQLLLLKRDRSKYIRSQDVMLLYDQVVEQVKRVNEIRKGEDKAENRCKNLKTSLPIFSLIRHNIVYDLS